MPDDFEPEDDDFEPDPETPQNDSWLGSTWDWLNAPLSGGAIRRNIADPFAEFMYETGNKYAKTPLVNYAYGMGAMAQSVGDQLDLMTSPGQLGLMAATGGASHYAGAAKAAMTAGNYSRAAELIKTAKALEAPGRAAALGMVGHGGYRAATADNLEEGLSGGLEAVLGGLGIRSLAPKPKVEILPKLLEANNPFRPPTSEPRFYAGEAGVTEAGRSYPIDLTSPLPGDMVSGSGTVLPTEYGRVTRVSPTTAARVGNRVGAPSSTGEYTPLVIGDSYIDPVTLKPRFPEPGAQTATNIPGPSNPFAGMTPEEIRIKLGINDILKGHNTGAIPEFESPRMPAMTEENLARLQSDNPPIIDDAGGLDFIPEEVQPLPIDQAKLQEFLTNTIRPAVEAPPQGQVWDSATLKAKGMEAFNEGKDRAMKAFTESQQQPQQSVINQAEPSIVNQPIVEQPPIVNQAAQQVEFPISETDPPYIQALKQRVNTLASEVRQTGKLSNTQQAELDTLSKSLTDYDSGGAPAAANSPVKKSEPVQMPPNVDKTNVSQVRQYQEAQVASTDKLNTVIKTAIEESIAPRAEQEAIYSQIRGRKYGELGAVETPGEAGFREQLKIMRGAMPKVEGIEAIRPQLEQADIDNLFGAITTSNLDEFKKLRTKVALTKLLDGTAVPQENEIKLLSEVFGEDIGGSLIELHGGLGALGVTPAKVSNFVSQSANFYKSAMSAIDLSIPLKNGLPGILQKAWWTSLDDMVKAWPSEKFYEYTRESIMNDPYFSLADLAGVDFLDMSRNLSKRDEAFHSPIAENMKIPGLSGALSEGIGLPPTVAKYTDPLQLYSAGIRASNRAATTWGNKYRMDVFKSLIQAKMKIMDPASIKAESVADTVKDAKVIAKFVNSSSGRGHLPNNRYVNLEKIGPELNAVLFSPKLQASRMYFLNPMNYIGEKNALVRKEMFKSALGVGLAWGIINEAYKLAGAEVLWDPTKMTSADWGKAKFGDTRAEPSGSFQKFVVAMARVVQNKTTSTTTGQETPLNEPGRYSPDKGGILTTLFENALSPAASLYWGMWTGKDFLDRPFNVKNELIRRVTPIMSQDLYDIQQSDPDLVPLGLSSVIGIGLNTYDKDPRTGRPRRPQRPQRPVR